MRSVAFKVSKIDCTIRCFIDLCQSWVIGDKKLIYYHYIFLFFFLQGKSNKSKFTYLLENMRKKNKC